MNCNLHPATPATATCHSCGCGLCPSCFARSSQLRCQHCVAQENATVARTAYRTLAVSVIFFLVGFSLAGVWLAAAPSLHPESAFDISVLFVHTPIATSASRAAIRIREKEREAIHPPADQRPAILLQSIIGLQLAFTYLVWNSLAAHIRSRRIVRSRLLPFGSCTSCSNRCLPAGRGFPHRLDCRALSALQITSPDPNRTTHQTRTCNFLIAREYSESTVSTSLAHLADAPRGQSLQAVLVCACGSLDIAARGMCPRCLARQHHDREYFGGHRETVLRRDKWTCQGCFYRPPKKTAIGSSSIIASPASLNRADDFSLRRLPRHCRAPASSRCMAPTATRHPVA